MSADESARRSIWGQVRWRRASSAVTDTDEHNTDEHTPEHRSWAARLSLRGARERRPTPYPDSPEGMQMVSRRPVYQDMLARLRDKTGLARPTTYHAVPVGHDENADPSEFATIEADDTRLLEGFEGHRTPQPSTSSPVDAEPGMVMARGPDEGSPLSPTNSHEPHALDLILEEQPSRHLSIAAVLAQADTPSQPLDGSTESDANTQALRPRSRSVCSINPLPTPRADMDAMPDLFASQDPVSLADEPRSPSTTNPPALGSHPPPLTEAVERGHSPSPASHPAQDAEAEAAARKDSAHSRRRSSKLSAILQSLPPIIRPRSKPALQRPAGEIPPLNWKPPPTPRLNPQRPGVPNPTVAFSEPAPPDRDTASHRALQAEVAYNNARTALASRANELDMAGPSPEAAAALETEGLEAALAVEEALGEARRKSGRRVLNERERRKAVRTGRRRAGLDRGVRARIRAWLE